MSDRCGQEMCHNWGGSGCVCEVLGIEPDIEPDPDYLEEWRAPTPPA